MSSFIESRIAQLSTGEVVPLLSAARWLSHLSDCVRTPDDEWDIVYHLRQACLGHPPAPEIMAALAADDFVTADGEVDPVVRAVVLAAVRGEGRALHLVSPFTEASDRMIANFVAAREYLEVELSPAEFQELLAGDGTADRVRAALQSFPLPPDVADAESFARRCREDRPRGGPDTPPR